MQEKQLIYEVTACMTWCSIPHVLFFIGIKSIKQHSNVSE